MPPMAAIFGSLALIIVFCSAALWVMRVLPLVTPERYEEIRREDRQASILRQKRRASAMEKWLDEEKQKIQKMEDLDTKEEVQSKKVQ